MAERLRDRYGATRADQAALNGHTSDGRDKGAANTGHEVDVAGQGGREASASVSRSGASDHGTSGGGPTVGHAAPIFRNRNSELDQVVNGLWNPHGEQFWLVIAPPQLGKSYFLHMIQRRLDRDLPGRWRFEHVDLRTEPQETVREARALVKRLFNLQDRYAMGPADPARIVNAMRTSGKYWICLLDSAELLEDNTAREFREYIGDICQRMVDAGNPNVRLALIVASRRDTQWRGIDPSPRFHSLPLSEFKDSVIYEALEQMGHNIEPVALQKLAQSVHRLSEGLPALLVGYLDQIEAEGWADLERRAEQQGFDELARPYVEEVLLSEGSLLGRGGDLPREQPDAIEQPDVIKLALKALVPYRLVTQSHLSYHARQGDLGQALGELSWPVERLWAAVSGTDLLHRPQGEPWHVIHAPIRRLLCRYWYPDASKRAHVHQEAIEVVRSFAAESLGQDYLYVLVQSLWHKAQFLQLSGATAAAFDRELIGLARELSRSLTGSAAFDPPTLRESAAERIQADQELEETLVGYPELFGRLIEAVSRP